ncbi:MAG: hypothetical protein Q9166_002418 [cf. Caloplaca sp. 2 TL-2023]
MPPIIVKCPSYSDGDASHRPDKNSQTRSNEDLWLQKIAERWMKEDGGGLQAGPKKKGSPRTSVTHPLAAPRRPGRPPTLQRGPVDEEGTPDVYQSFFTLLKNEGSLSRSIEERASLDWRAERPLVDNLSKKILNQPSFIPRNGEVVLYLRPLPPNIQLRQDPKTQHFFLLDTQNNHSAGAPQWLAGLITQVPLKTPAHVSLNPPSAIRSKETNHEIDTPSLNLSGFRIEPLPSPNSSDKNLSKQHTYIPLHLIRPLAFWQSLLKGTPESSWHVSIHNALTASATVSLIDRYNFVGRWPNAKIYSRGLFVGAESYWLGDTIRLLFESSPSLKHSSTLDLNTTVVMEIKQIITSFYNLAPEPSNDRIVTGNRCDMITITLQGFVYTSKIEASSSRVRVRASEQSNLMRDFPTEWYHIAQPNDVHYASFSNIHSRLYDFAAMESYFPALPAAALLNFDATGEAITQARAVAAATDERILDTIPSKRWFWAEHRAEALDLETINGLEVGNCDTERQPKVWREVLSVVDGRKERVDKNIASDVNGNGVGGMVEGPEDDDDDDDDDEGEEEEDEGEGVEDEGNGEEEESSDDVLSGNKRASAADEDDEMMELEAPEKKRARVEVKVPLK